MSKSDWAVHLSGKICLITSILAFITLYFSPVPSAKAKMTIHTTTVSAQSSYTYYLPFLANSYAMSGTISGTFTTFLAIQNVSESSANITVQYYAYSNNGSYDTYNPITTPSTTCTTINLHAECIAPNPFEMGGEGSGIITSDQSLNVIVSEATPYGSTAYVVPTEISNYWLIPFISKNAFGGYSTQIILSNPTNQDAIVHIDFWYQDKPFNSISTDTAIASHGNVTIDQNDLGLPDGFVGYARISAKAVFDGSAAVSITAQVLQINPNTHFLSITNAPDLTAESSVQTNTIYVPTVFNRAFGTFSTGLNLLNIGGQDITVTITYYDKNGAITNTAPFTIPANEGYSIYHGATGGKGLPLNGLPRGFYGSAVITKQGVGTNLVVLVNEIGGLTASGTGQTGSYNAPFAGNSTIYLPVMDNGRFGFTTGTTLFNISNQSLNISVQYYNLDGTPQGNAKMYTISPKASLSIYQGDPLQELPSDFEGSAVVTEVNGSSSNSLIATTNVQSFKFFYTYTLPGF